MWNQKNCSEIPGSLMVRTQVHSLVREQRSHTPLSMAKKKRVLKEKSANESNEFIHRT